MLKSVCRWAVGSTRTARVPVASRGAGVAGVRLATRRGTTTTVEEALAQADDEQRRLMAEECILVDADDVIIGSASKKTCHQMVNIDKGMLHRAFSVFLFNQDGNLLLQKRASPKITFPDMWTNTCCSHPLHRETEVDGVPGAVAAGIRKLEHELGIDPSEIPASGFRYLTRIHYKSSSDKIWGEHEVDYILFAQPKVDVTLRVNENEISEYKYVDEAELRGMMQAQEREEVLLTPWFRLIADTQLFPWWQQLRSGGLGSLPSDDVIHRY